MKLKLKIIILKSIRMLLAFTILFQQIPFVETKANAEETVFPSASLRLLFYTDPFKCNYFNNINGIDDELNLLEYIQEASSDAASSSIQRTLWKTLTETDQLSIRVFLP